MKHLTPVEVPREVNLLRIALTLRKTASRALVALADGRVPGRLKLIALAAAVFIISPLNLLGDIPLLGVFDDAALLSVVMVWFTRVSLPYMQTHEAGPIARR